MSKILELDARRRCAFGKIGDPDIDRYLVEEHSDGTLTLTPAVVIPAHEYRLMANTELHQQLIDAAANPGQAKPSPARRPRN